MDSSKRWRVKFFTIFSVVSILIAMVFFFQNTQPEVITISSSDDVITPTNSPEITQTTATENNSKKNTVCSKSLTQQVRAFSLPKWKDFKQQIYLTGIRYPVLQLAISNLEPIHGVIILQQSINPLENLNTTDEMSRLSSEYQMQIIGIILAEGAQGIIDRVESGKLPAAILTETGDAFFDILVDFATQTKTTNILPNEEEMIQLIGYGLEITVEDYNKATIASAPVEFLELLTTLGPSPESANNKYDKIPLDYAARSGNIELMEFWFKTDFKFSSRLHGGDFNDTLFLSASSNAELLKYWNFLQNWNSFPRNPETARKLLSSAILNIEGELKLQLEKLAQEKSVRIKLAPNDQSYFNDAISQIESINLSITTKYPNYKICLSNKNDKQDSISLNSKWIMDQLHKGSNVDDIVKILAQQSPQKVDSFRSSIERGLYKPFLLPKGNIKKIDAITQKAFGFAILKDWQSLRDLVDSGSLNDKARILLLNDRGDLKIPEQLRDKLTSQIQSLPIESFDKVVTSLDINKIEQMNLTSESLNQLDHQGKNLFYYAAKRNNSDLMNWLVEHNVEMDADQYGSDPLDAILKWNTHADSLATLCTLGFPIKDKHRKRLQEIRDEDPVEADEIVASCPGFGE